MPLVQGRVVDPFGHTRPQWILPHGGTITVDGTARCVTAGYS